MKQFIIDRSKWRIGGSIYDNTHGDTQLLNDKGFMCCLGFYCNQIGGVPKKGLKNVGYPSNLFRFKPEKNKYEKRLRLLVNPGAVLRSTKICLDAMNINDDNSITNQKRELQIKELFNEEGVDVIFINEYKQ